jgi:hypothetical protein
VCKDVATGLDVEFPYELALPPYYRATVGAVALLTAPAARDPALLAARGLDVGAAGAESARGRAWLWEDVYAALGYTNVSPFVHFWAEVVFRGFGSGISLSLSLSLTLSLSRERECERGRFFFFLLPRRRRVVPSLLARAPPASFSPQK